MEARLLIFLRPWHGLLPKEIDILRVAFLTTSAWEYQVCRDSARFITCILFLWLFDSNMIQWCTLAVRVKSYCLLKGFSRQIIHAVIVTQSLRKRFTCSSCSSSSWLLPEIVSVVRVLNDFIQLLFYFYLHDLSWKLDRETKKDSLGNKFPRNHSANPFPSQGCQSSSLKVCNKIKRIWIFSFLPTQCQRIAMNCKTTDTLTDITEWWCLSFQFRDSHCLSFVHINLDTIRWRNACILSRCFFSFEDSILWSCFTKLAIVVSVIWN